MGFDFLAADRQVAIPVFVFMPLPFPTSVWGLIYESPEFRNVSWFVHKGCRGFGHRPGSAPVGATSGQLSRAVASHARNPAFAVTP